MCPNNYAEWSSWVAESIKTQGAKGPRPQETRGPKGPWAQRLPRRRWAQVPLDHPRIPWTPPPWGPASCEKLKFTFREKIVTCNGRRPGLAKPGAQCAGPASWLASLAGCQPGGPACRRATRGHRQNAKIGCPSDLRNTCFFVRPARTSDFEWFLIENMCYFSNVLAGRSFF